MKAVSLVLLPRFQMLAYVLATETLRIANKSAGETLFRWRTFTADDEPVAASNGARVSPDRALGDDRAGHDLILVCAGYAPLESITGPLRVFLHRAAGQGVTLGGLDTGTMVLAKLGLLDGYRAVLHHEAEAGFRELWPEISISGGLYCLDRDRLTAAGGVSTADAVLSWIAEVHSRGLADVASVALLHGRIRPTGEPQRRPARQTLLSRVIALMEENLVDPISIEALAEQSGVSKRKMFRRFKNEFGCPPSVYYLNLRLDRARDLIATTDLPMRAVANATGFSSPSWFSNAYKRRFGVPPLQHRGALAEPAGDRGSPGGPARR